MEIDSKDLLILKSLQEDSEISNKEVAHSAGLSISTIFERIKKMKRAGIIKKQVYLLNKKKLGFNLVVIISVSLKNHTKEYIHEFMEEMKKHPEIVECHHISGGFDFSLKVVAKNIEKYQEFMLNKISQIRSIGHIESYFVMQEVKFTTSLPLEV
ncbi:MAG: Lrp/AsnC family transcriptional regulator [Flavobacteriia bacterium]|nr:Lrp/AsnC family transcriptional regulator [Flavobacteriia bacterium]